MKVLNVGSFWQWGMEGVGRLIGLFSDALAERGHEVLTLTSPGSAFATMFSGKQESVKVRGSWDFLAVTRVRQRVEDGGFDVVLVHSPGDAEVVLKAIKGSGVKVVYCRHVGQVMKKREAEVVGKCDLVIVGSEAGKRGLRASGVEASRIRVVLPGCRGLICDDRECARRKVGVGGFGVGLFGRIVPESGFLAGIDAVVHHCKRPVSLHLFGTGSGLEEVRTVCKEVWQLQWLEGQVGSRERPLEGLVSHGSVLDVVSAMAAMDAVLIPSHLDLPFCFEAAEAMSLGVPVVGFNVFSMGEVIADGGVLAEDTTMSALGAGVERLVDDEEFRREVGARGRKRIEEVLSFERFGERFEQALSEDFR